MLEYPDFHFNSDILVIIPSKNTILLYARLGSIGVKIGIFFSVNKINLYQPYVTQTCK